MYIYIVLVAVQRIKGVSGKDCLLEWSEKLFFFEIGNGIVLKVCGWHPLETTKNRECLGLHLQVANFIQRLEFLGRNAEKRNFCNKHSLHTERMVMHENTSN